MVSCTRRRCGKHLLTLTHTHMHTYVHMLSLAHLSSPAPPALSCSLLLTHIYTHTCYDAMPCYVVSCGVVWYIRKERISTMPLFTQNLLKKIMADKVRRIPALVSDTSAMAMHMLLSIYGAPQLYVTGMPRFCADKNGCGSDSTLSFFVSPPSHHAPPPPLLPLMPSHCKAYDSPHYHEIENTFTSQFMIRLSPRPDIFNMSLRHMNSALYKELQGPSQFILSGKLQNWSVTEELWKIKGNGC